MDKKLIVNKSITDKITKNSVILDPAGLYFMKNGFSGAGGASGGIYKLLDTKNPNEEVIKHFMKFKNEDELYEKNKSNLSIACYGSYNNDKIKLIHTVGPNFMASKYLYNIINNDRNDNKLNELFLKIYEDVYKEFMEQYKKNNKLKLRLLPISSGIYINNNLRFKIKIFNSLILIYLYLNEKYKIQPKIYLYDKNDYDLILKLIPS
jgi:hypothetical protein